MATLKKLLFFLCAVTLLRASPALSVPLAPAANDQAVSQAASDPDGGQYSPFRQVGSDGGSDARIVGSEELAYGPQPSSSKGLASSLGSSSHSNSPGWIKPVAGIAAGSSLFALVSHGKGNGGGSGGLTAGGRGLTNNGGQGGTGDTPSDVPEPGTMLLMGLGIAGYLGGRKAVKK
jgi:hypothetical protein